MEGAEGKVKRLYGGKKGPQDSFLRKERTKGLEIVKGRKAGEVIRWKLGMQT